MRKAMEELNSDLELRNAQIQNLQKQITEAEANNNSNGGGHHVAAAGTGGGSSKVGRREIHATSHFDCVIYPTRPRSRSSSIKRRKIMYDS